MARQMVFWDVDTQADFIDAKGKLYVPGAEAIVANLERLTASARDAGVLLISSACAHRPGDAEFAAYPPHCLVGTPGQQKIPETRLPDAITLPNRWVELPEDLFGHQQIVLEKQQLNVFSNPNAERMLQWLGPVDEIVLYGVVTEICVAYAAWGLMRRGYRLRVVNDAVRHLDETKATVFLDEISKRGCAVTTTGAVVEEIRRRRAA